MDLIFKELTADDAEIRYHSTPCAPIGPATVFF